jgi:hypothetical protein
MCLGTVMVIVMEKKALISGVLATMTVMTLMTVFCGGFLSRGQLVLPSTTIHRAGLHNPRLKHLSRAGRKDVPGGLRISQHNLRHELQHDCRQPERR